MCNKIYIFFITITDKIDKLRTKLYITDSTFYNFLIRMLTDYTLLLIYGFLYILLFFFCFIYLLLNFNKIKLQKLLFRHMLLFILLYLKKISIILYTIVKFFLLISLVFVFITALFDSEDIYSFLTQFIKLNVLLIRTSAKRIVYLYKETFN
jgi:hypothetical protein